MTDSAIDTSEMLTIHNTLREEFASLPLLVKGTPRGDAERAGIVGNHVLLVLTVLERHHGGEDELMWPKLVDRSPTSSELVAEMEAQHLGIHGGIDAARAAATTWMVEPTDTNRAALHVVLISLERSLLEHLGREEMDVLPIVSATMSEAEFAELGEHARAGLDQQQLTLALGMILDHSSVEEGEAILGAMPPEARAGFEQFGKPAYAAYRARLIAEA